MDTFPWVSDTLSCSSKLSNFLWVPAARYFCPFTVHSKCCLSRSHVLFAKNGPSYPFLHLFHHLTWYIWRIIMNYVTEWWMIIRNSFRLKMFDTAFFFVFVRCYVNVVEWNLYLFLFKIMSVLRAYPNCIMNLIGSRSCKAGRAWLNLKICWVNLRYSFVKRQLTSDHNSCYATRTWVVGEGIPA